MTTTVVALAPTACGGPGEVVPGHDAVGKHQEALSLDEQFGMERAIPLRIVMTARDCHVTCGDGLCDAGESCPQDCPVCGNGTCDVGETTFNCPQDCPCSPPSCPNWGPVNPAWECKWRSQPPNSCSTCSNGDTYCGVDTADFTEIRHGVEQANLALKALGVQVFVSSIEKYKMPLFWNDPDGSQQVKWNDGVSGGVDDELRAQLKLAYPSLTDTTFNNADKITERFWLSAVPIRVGNPREIVVWVAECSAGFDGRRPWGGASSLVADREIFQRPFALAHELGHILGLEHTMYPQNASNAELQGDYGLGDAGTGPRDNTWDYWDLVYTVNGSQNVYFSSRTDAMNWFNSGYSLYPKHTWDPNGANQNCVMDDNCTLSCTINGHLETIGTQGIWGLGFTYPGDNPGQSIYLRGANAMMYLWAPPQCQKRATFAESQAEQTKRLLRADGRIDNETEVLAGYSRQFTSKRDLVGDWRGRWGFDQLDFDGDGKRDIAVWQPPSEAGGACGDGKCSLSESTTLCPLDCVISCPGCCASQCGNGACDAACGETAGNCPKDCGGPDPCGDGVCGLSETPSSCSADCASTCGNGFCGAGETTTCPKDCGTFRALLSSTNYATVLERNLGRPGDQPVAADFDGDGKTDFGVIRGGGLTSDSATDTTLWWIWCRSSNNHACAQVSCTWPSECIMWGARGDVPLPGLQMDANTTTKELTVYRPSDNKIYWIAVDQSGSGNFYTRFETPTVLLPGLYDTDAKSDIVAYNPINARFWMLLSTHGWDYLQGVARYFDVALRPNAISASDAGSSAPAVRHGGVPLPADNNGRRALRVWDPYTGNWHTMWDPVNSSGVEICQWGAPRDIPLEGPIDRNADGLTDLAVFRPTYSPPTVFVRSATSSLCSYSGSDYSFTVTGGTPRSAISAVPDMSADGRGDVLVLDPNTNTWTRYYSQAFAAQTGLTLGDVSAVPL